MERNEIIKIMENELGNQPMASQRTRDAYSALDDALNEYINAIQEDDFFFFFITAMKRQGASVALTD